MRPSFLGWTERKEPQKVLTPGRGIRKGHTESSSDIDVDGEFHVCP